MEWCCAYCDLRQFQRAFIQIRLLTGGNHGTQCAPCLIGGAPCVARDSRSSLIPTNGANSGCLVVNPRKYFFTFAVNAMGGIPHPAGSEAQQPLMISFYGFGERRLTGAGGYSPYRPQPAGRDRYPISIVRASWASGEWPLFAEQIDVITASTRPQPAGRAYVSIFAGGAPGD